MTKDTRDRREYMKKYRENPKNKIRKRIWSREWAKKWRKANPEKDRENRRNYYLNGGKEYRANWSKNTIAGKYKEYRNNAKRLNVPFEISKSYFKRFWQKPCSYCGAEMKTIGLDRKIGKKGYVVGNLRSSCTLCNAMKSDRSEKVFLSQVKNICKYSIKN